MIVPDVNLLVYAYNATSPQHARASAWWERLMEGEEPVGLPWAVVCGFVRLVTHPAVLDEPLSPAAALDRVDRWLEQENVCLLDPGPQHVAILRTLFAATGVAGSLTTDAHVAAIAIEHRAEVHSNDADFARFPGLRLHNPLAGSPR